MTKLLIYITKLVTRHRAAAEASVHGHAVRDHHLVPAEALPNHAAILRSEVLIYILQISKYK